MSDIDYTTECMTRDLVIMLIQENNMSLLEALDAVYNSETFSKLKNPATGLYFQSPIYVYNYLNRELTTGKLI